MYENLASAQEINHILTVAQKYLIHYNLDAVRVALAPLKDKMDIKTISIPMKIFPVATQKALDALNKGDAQKAMAIMAEGYNTFLQMMEAYYLKLMGFFVFLSLTFLSIYLYLGYRKKQLKKIEKIPFKPEHRKYLHRMPHYAKLSDADKKKIEASIIRFSYTKEFIGVKLEDNSLL